MCQFLKEYADTGEEWRLSFAALKLLQLLQIALTLECGDYLVQLNEIWGIILTEFGVTDDDADTINGIIDGVSGIFGIETEGGDQAQQSQGGTGGATEDQKAQAAANALAAARAAQAAAAEVAAANAGKARRLLLGDPELIRSYKGPLVQADEAPPNAFGDDLEAVRAKLKSDRFGNVTETETTEISTSSFEWIYAVMKGGENLVSLGELGVDADMVYESWMNERYYDAGNFIGQCTFVVLDEVVELWNTVIAQNFDDPNDAILKMGSKYGPVKQAGNRTEGNLYISRLLDTGVDIVEGTIPDDVKEDQEAVETLNANEIVPNANPCIRQTVSVTEDEPLKFKIKAGGQSFVKTDIRAFAMFENADVNRCPTFSVDLYDSAGEPLSEDVAKIIKIKDVGSNIGKIYVYSEFFVSGSGPINVQLGMLTGFGELVFKQIEISEKTPCQLSRIMKASSSSKCTIDTEQDTTNKLRGEECSTMAFCWDSGYKNSMCPENEHCAQWRLPGESSPMVGCVLSNSCFENQIWGGEEITYNCVDPNDRDTPVPLPDDYLAIDDATCLAEAA